MTGDGDSGRCEGSGRPCTDGGTGTGREAVSTVVGRQQSAVDVPARLGWRQVRTVASQEYTLSVRNRWAMALTALFAAMSLLVVASGSTGPGPTRFGPVVLGLAQLATYLVPLAALVFAFDAVVGAEESGWLDVVFALPVHRWRVVAGTFLGRAVTLSAATTIGFGLAGGVLFLDGLFDPRYLVLLVAVAGLGATFLSVGVLVSTVAREKTHALGIALLVWVWFVFVHDLLALGLVTGGIVPGEALSALLLLNPADVFRVIVLGQLPNASGGLATVLAGTGLSLPVLALAMLAWIAAPLALAGRLVRRRSI